MEIFGILFSVPAAFGASVVYSFFIRWFVGRLPWSRGPIMWGSAAVLAGLALEWCLLGTVGVLRARDIVGASFCPAHTFLFFLSIPALANLLTLRRRGGVLARWFTVGVLCAVLDLPVVVTQYAVSEALYGIDGAVGADGKQ